MKGYVGWSQRPEEPIQLANVAEVDSHSSDIFRRTSDTDVRNDDGPCSRTDLERPAHYRVDNPDDSLYLRSEFCFWSDGPCTYDGSLWQEASVARCWQFLHSLEHSLWLFAQQWPDDCQSFSLRLGS
jgi:hypothetical protein